MHRMDVPESGLSVEIKDVLYAVQAMILEEDINIFVIKISIKLYESINYT